MKTDMVKTKIIAISILLLFLSTTLALADPVYQKSTFGCKVSVMPTTYVPPTYVSPPTDIIEGNITSTSINLTFTEFSYPPGVTHTIIRYNNGTTPPSSLTEGTFAGNTTNEYILISALTLDSDYAFSFWTIWEGPSGEWINSTDYTTFISSTVGGLYAIFLFDEETKLRLNFSLYPYNISNFILKVHYVSGTTDLHYINGDSTAEAGTGVTLLYANSNTSFNITANDTVWYFELFCFYKFDFLQLYTFTQTSRNAYTRKLTPFVGHIEDLLLGGNRSCIDFYVANRTLYGSNYYEWENTSTSVGDLRIKIDIQTVANPTINELISTTHYIEEIVGVYMYNSSENLTGWFSVPNDMYTEVPLHDGVVVDEAILDDAGTNPYVRVDYYYTVTTDTDDHDIVAKYNSEFEGSVVHYEYNYQDSSGRFLNKNPNTIFISIYEPDTKYVIHQEFLTSAKTNNPFLIYDKSYLLGIYSTEDDSAPNIGIAPASSNRQPYIYITSTILDNVVFNSITVTANRSSDGTYIYATYYDKDISTNNVTFALYNSTALVESAIRYTHNTYYNFTGLNASQPYYVVFHVNKTFNADTTPVTIYAYKIIYRTNITNATITAGYIDTLITGVIGPVFIGTSWSLLIVVFLGLVVFLSLLFTAGPVASFIVSGIIIIALNTLISGLNPILYTVGVLLVVLGFIILLIERRS
jgi:hypothetical protein